MRSTGAVAESPCKIIDSLSVVYIGRVSYLPDRQRRDSAERIERALREAADGLTMRELVTATGMHENALRRSLARLAARADVSVEPEQRNSSGRPALRYRLAEAPDAPFRRFLPLLLELLAAVPVSDEAAYAVGHARAEQGAGASASEAVRSSLAGLGFAPRARGGTRAGTTRLELGRCPFSEIVTSSSEGARVCALHHGLLAGVAEAQGGRLREFVINDPRSAPCEVAVLDAPVRA